MNAKRFLPSLVLLLASAAASAGELDLSGFLAAETRGFSKSPLYAEQTSAAEGSIVASPELRFRSAEGKWRAGVVPFLRLDAHDEERSHFDLREAWVQVLGDGWDVLLGLDKVFWGVTESRHLVDVVNQSDLVEDVDLEDKLGQPMVRLVTRRAWGSLELFLLPGFRERTFPGVDGRLRGPLVVDGDAATYESAAGGERLDLALRYSHYVGDWDLGISYFDGTSREPLLRPSADGSSLLPHYQLVRQVGVDAQYTRGAWLWKLEALARRGPDEGFGAVVVGFERTLYQLGGKSADLGLLVEVLYDGRDPLLSPATPWDDDVFVGARLALNDAEDTAILAGAIVDRDNGSTAITLEASRRIGAGFTLEIESRLFVDPAREDPLSLVADDDFTTVRISRHF